MVGDHEEDNGSNSNDLDVEDNIEIEATKVEIGDNYVVVLDELENGDAFFVVLCNKPLLSNKLELFRLETFMETLNDGWGIRGMKVT
jgi:hypothetical protein